MQRTRKARDDTPPNGSITGGSLLFHRRGLRRLPQPPSRCAANTPNSINTAAQISSDGTPTDFTALAVMVAPQIPPSVAAAPIKPNSRFPCSLVNISTMKAQKTETTKRLKTEVQMKNALPTQTLAVPLEIRNNTRKTSRFKIKKRYAMLMKRMRGSHRTSTANAGLTAIMATRVPVNSHDKFDTPPAKPSSSRMGRIT